MPNMISLSLTVQKLWPRLNLGERDRQTDRTKTIFPRSFDLGALKKPDVFVKHECCHLQLSPKNYCRYMYQGCDQGHLKRMYN
jgi:hypothetical protein